MDFKKIVRENYTHGVLPWIHTVGGCRRLFQVSFFMNKHCYKTKIGTVTECQFTKNNIDLYKINTTKLIMYWITFFLSYST